MAQEEDDLSKLMGEVEISQKAQRLIRYLGLGCPVSDKDKKQWRGIPNLSDLLTLLPTAAIDLFAEVNDQKKDGVELVDVVRLFSGFKHILYANWRTDPTSKKVVAKTKQSFKQRMEELGVDLDVSLNQSIYFFADVLTVARITSIEGHRAMLEKNGLVIGPCYLPGGVKAQEGNIGWIHFATVCNANAHDHISSPPETDTIQQQKNNETWQAHLKALIEDLPEMRIDYSEFCFSSTQSKTKPFDLYSWTQDQFG